MPCRGIGQETFRFTSNNVSRSSLDALAPCEPALSLTQRSSLRRASGMLARRAWPGTVVSKTPVHGYKAHAATGEEGIVRRIGISPAKDVDQDATGRLSQPDS